MTLWPFMNEQRQKQVSLVVLIAGIILIFTVEDITTGAILSILGLVYLLDTI